MQKIDYLDVQSQLAKTMRHVCEQDTPVTINGAGKDQVVMMPLETFHKLSQPSLEPLNSPCFKPKVTRSAPPHITG